MSKKVKIAHSLDQLEDQVILTLVDRPLLSQGKLNEDDDDVLQNDEIQLNNETKHNLQLKGKLKNIADASSSHLEAKNQGLSGMLPHYDDYSYKPKTIEVQEGAIIKPRAFKKGKALGSDYQNDDGATTTKLKSQYVFKKDQKKNIPKTSARDLLNFLDQTAQDNVTTAKKEQEREDIIKQSIDQLKKKRILENSIKDIVQGPAIDDEEESLLLKAIERSRKKAQTKNEKKFNLLEAIKEEDDPQNRQTQGQKVEIQLNPISRRATDNIRQNKGVDLNQAVSGTSSVMFAYLPSETLARKNKQTQKEPVKMQDFSREELEKMREEVQFLQDKEVGLGLAGTLSFLRDNALLNKEEQVGRYHDKSVDYNDPNDRIKLEYRNASGKLMKPKQAYRYICAKFHGQGPSKNKVQIRKKRELQQLRTKQQLNDGGKLLKLLQQHQQKSNQAHMVLNFGGKGGKQQ